MSLGSSPWENGLLCTDGRCPPEEGCCEPKVGFQIANPTPPIAALDKSLIFAKPWVPHVQNGYNPHGVVRKVQEYHS